MYISGVLKYGFFLEEKMFLPNPEKGSDGTYHGRPVGGI